MLRRIDRLAVAADFAMEPRPIDLADLAAPDLVIAVRRNRQLLAWTDQIGRENTVGVRSRVDRLSLPSRQFSRKGVGRATGCCGTDRGPEGAGMQALSMSAETRGRIHGRCARMQRSYHEIERFPASRTRTVRTTSTRSPSRKAHRGLSEIDYGLCRGARARRRYSHPRWPRSSWNVRAFSPSDRGRTSNRGSHADPCFQ